MYGRNLRAYRNTSVSAEIAVADPYVITKMLYQGIFERLAQAKGAIERGDLAAKAQKLASATAIIENLKNTLDFKRNAAIAQNFSDIYDYMLERIADAAVQISTTPIDQALQIFMPIKQAWDSIPVEAQKEAAVIRAKDADSAEFQNTQSLARGTI
ncbi:MAG: flagellar export chaperone FliS [Proteobacteria bacterium]|uniref:Flagellar secretion chaperone FliS n=1 Tax=Candidatus Avisuccinivibrio stercorigallinarum TaxID=2840704 RepID=A0A9D9D8J8_9GAMM|nr:flagellar export chaperone FliS [Candidatus Avisuccinivibrio stercorigallinarum]